jgi:acyl-[acyl-carrier-protein]-phospholipid O-acyltransferase/long-chain-fatty-acid--[acyl-carrier-protein] ligase
MVSLAVVENNAAATWPDYQHAAVSVEDDRRGEQVILVTDNPTAERDALLQKSQELGFGEIMVPRTILVADSIPLLGTGKVDYVAVKALALASVAKSETADTAPKSGSAA